MNRGSRVIMVDGRRSGWYEKAIFILTEDKGSRNVPGDIVMQAEHIVESYLKKELNGQVEKGSLDYKKNQPSMVKASSTQSMKVVRGIAILSGLLCVASFLAHIL